METIKVKALSRKAKNRLANLMDKNPEVVVERREGDGIFFRSMNGNYYAWIFKGDKDWRALDV